MTDFGDLNNLKTGDLLLFKSKPKNIIGILDAIIRFFTKSDFVHIGMILKNPSFIDTPLKGLYLWESSWEGTPDSNDGRIKLGVQITPLFQILKDFSNKENGEIYIRQVHCNPNKFSFKNLLNVYKIVHNKLGHMPYTNNQCIKCHNIHDNNFTESYDGLLVFDFDNFFK